MAKDLSSAKTACFRLLKVRPRSEYELRSRLLQKGFENKVIEEAITAIAKIGLVNDLEFAKLWVQSRIKKPLGLKRLSFELKQKGIDKDIIEKIISEYNCPEKEEKVVRELLERKLKKFSGLDKQKIKERLWGFFLRKGFSKDIVYDVLNEL
ncbi:MAG: regulatory protein RecX [Candidatus Omnitrophica bacterium]|nr:regulatory protein RecX [Candidatus Omnitrophota bacterium]